MRDYRFIDHKTDAVLNDGAVTVMCTNPKIAEAAYAPLLAVIEGTFLTRDLVNEPANVLTTNNFANRLEEMSALGLKVEVLDEKELEQLGMRTLLCVGQGSESPSKVVIMKWDGGQQNITPFALVGKGVVFDTGGISLKPAAGMEDMTMDMGGAGVVAGAMRALALRKAKANVVGIVGLVENMPSGNATRPGDVIKSMKGDTVEVINTDAEGRLVLCDLLWYAQERFNPSGIIDLATLTGAIIIGLGHEKAGVFSNNDKLCNAFLKVAGPQDQSLLRSFCNVLLNLKLRGSIWTLLE
jgi:leucyl aminopeptidase